jgi:hypothetical protein
MSVPCAGEPDVGRRLADAVEVEKERADLLAEDESAKARVIGLPRDLRPLAVEAGPEAHVVDRGHRLRLQHEAHGPLFAEGVDHVVEQGDLLRDVGASRGVGPEHVATGLLGRQLARLVVVGVIPQGVGPVVAGAAQGGVQGCDGRQQHLADGRGERGVHLLRDGQGGGDVVVVPSATAHRLLKLELDLVGHGLLNDGNVVGVCDVEVAAMGRDMLLVEEAANVGQHRALALGRDGGRRINHPVGGAAGHGSGGNSIRSRCGGGRGHERFTRNCRRCRRISHHSADVLDRERPDIRPSVPASGVGARVGHRPILARGLDPAVLLQFAQGGLDLPFLHRSQLQVWRDGDRPQSVLVGVLRVHSGDELSVAAAIADHGKPRLGPVHLTADASGVELQHDALVVSLTQSEVWRVGHMHLPHAVTLAHRCRQHVEQAVAARLTVERVGVFAEIHPVVVASLHDLREPRRSRCRLGRGSSSIASSRCVRATQARGHHAVRDVHRAVSVGAELAQLRHHVGAEALDHLLACAVDARCADDAVHQTAEERALDGVLQSDLEDAVVLVGCKPCRDVVGRPGDRLHEVGEALVLRVPDREVHGGPAKHGLPRPSADRGRRLTSH